MATSAPDLNKIPPAARAVLHAMAATGQALIAKQERAAELAAAEAEFGRLAPYLAQERAELKARHDRERAELEVRHARQRAPLDTQEAQGRAAVEAARAALAAAEAAVPAAEEAFAASKAAAAAEGIPVPA